MSNVDSAVLFFQVSVLQSDYNQERATASQATELLDQETSRRLLLEAELYDLQSHLEQSTEKMSELSQELTQLKEIHQQSYSNGDADTFEDMADGKPVNNVTVHSDRSRRNCM